MNILKHGGKVNEVKLYIIGTCRAGSSTQVHPTGGRRVVNGSGKVSAFAKELVVVFPNYYSTLWFWIWFVVFMKW